MNKPAHYEHRVVAAASLVPYANNSRTHSEQQVQQVAASIKEWGFTNPVLIDEGNGVVAGHCRLEAAQLLGMTDVPCIVLAGLSDAQRKAYVIADNRLALNAGWDDELLRVELQGLAELDFDLELMGFDDDELVNFLAELDPDAPNQNGAGSLADRFMIPPFSVLNAREGWWQERKRFWLAFGINSELGRGDAIG